MSDFFLASYLLLWLLLGATVLALAGVARQVAVLTARTMPAEHLHLPGPELGQQALSTTGVDTNGMDVTIEPPFPRKTALLFMSADCSTCSELMPEIELVAAETTNADVWILSRSQLKGSSGPKGIVVAPEVFQSWGIESVPYAFVARANGTLEAKGHLNRIDRLRDALGLADEAAGSTVDSAGWADARDPVASN
jgi:hypothetical protein